MPRSHVHSCADHCDSGDTPQYQFLEPGASATMKNDSTQQLQPPVMSPRSTTVWRCISIDTRGRSKRAA